MVRVIMTASDAVTVVTSLPIAYYFRINFDARPFYFEANTLNFLILAISFVPIWLITNWNFLSVF